MVHQPVASRASAIPAQDIAAIRYPGRFSPRTAPFAGTFALDYGSDLLPLMDTFSLQAVDPVFQAHCFSKEASGGCRELSRKFPHLQARFRCADVLWPLLVRSCPHPLPLSVRTAR
jgi:hypothetical protein